MTKVIIKPFFREAREWPLVRITKKWIVVRYNNIATSRYSRETGFEAGAFSDRFSSTPSKIINLEELNKLADDNGGTFEVEKRGKK